MIGSPKFRRSCKTRKKTPLCASVLNARGGILRRDAMAQRRIFFVSFATPSEFWRPDHLSYPTYPDIIFFIQLSSNFFAPLHLCVFALNRP